jgi:hypothetical protein
VARSLLTLARLFLRARAAAEKAEDLKAPLLAAMTSAGVSAVDVPGLGAVTYVPGLVRQGADVPALEAKIEELAARLRALGQDVDAVVPKKATTVAAGLRVSPPPAPAT